jgi:DNA-binding transcriptional LysR family regulator
MVTLPLVEAMTERHPNATLRGVSAYSRFLHDWLRRGDIDIAVLYDVGSTRTLRTEPLLDEELHLVGPAGAGLAVDRPVRFADLAGEALLLPSRGHGLRDLVDDAAASAGVEISVRIEADSYSILKDLVRAGHGRAILPLAPILADVAPRRALARPTDRADPGATPRARDVGRAFGHPPRRVRGGRGRRCGASARYVVRAELPCPFGRGP